MNNFNIIEKNNKCHNCIQWRKGVSLVELVLSMIIVSIVLMGVPTLLNQSTVADKTSIVQSVIIDAQEIMTLVLRAPYGCGEEIIGGGHGLGGQTVTPVFNYDDTSHPGKDFYDINGISKANRRIFVSRGPNDSCATTGESIPELDIDSTSTVTTSSLVSEISKKVEHKTIDDSIDNNVWKITIELFAQDDKKTESDKKDQTRVVLNSFVANIGDRPMIQSKVW
ncbi:prepilin-type N-terminal cleavage/methylation domain-containing protein [uncultured Campylobacter sp.]|uniref:type IV pilus modification PilV family protein n=1 Tax=uncultured Campylobacter sp. TaxID=218934 RepID=UPI0025EBE474|nr:prepilin-type N-terminal cleavage/methylation domain-containing protein [uncultured Campylobacter sp.]